jgi:hypothetical protein
MDGGGGGITADGTPTIAHYGDGIVLYDSLNYYYQPNVGADKTTDPNFSDPLALWSGYVAQDLEGDDFYEPVASLGPYHVSLSMSPQQVAPGGTCQLIVSGSVDPGVIVGGVTLQLKFDSFLLPIRDDSGGVSVASAYYAAANAYAVTQGSNSTSYLLVGVGQKTDSGIPAGEWARITFQIASNATAGNSLKVTGVSASATDASALSRSSTDISGSSASVSVVTTPKPAAKNQSVTTLHDRTKAITLAGTSSGGGSLTYSIANPPAHGSLSGGAPNLTYAPSKGYVGSDSFTFKVNDGVQDSDPGTVSVSVTNQAPAASNQTVTTYAAKNIALSATDADSDPLTYSIVSQPAHGALTGAAPNLTYTPANGYAGQDSFTFKANDSIVNSNVATVSITVLPPASGCSGSGCIILQNASGAPGGTAQVLVTADANVANLASLSLTVQYDPSVLSLSDNDILTQESGYLLKSDNVAVNAQTPGVGIVGLTGTKNVNGPGTIAQLNFHVSQSAQPGASYPISLQITAANALADQISLGTQSGSIFIGCATADVNGDGLVNILDAAKTLRIAVGLDAPTPLQLSEGDVNLDGKINILDAAKILRIAVGLDPKASGCQ